MLEKKSIIKITYTTEKTGEFNHKSKFISKNSTE